MKHFVKVKTAKRNGTSGSNGYTVTFSPPLTKITRTADIEGVGIWNYSPPKIERQDRAGWFRHREDAENFARVHAPWILSTCECSTCKPATEKVNLDYFS